MSIERCPHCGRIINKTIKSKKTISEKDSEIIKGECLKLQNKIDKLQYKHDFIELSNYEFCKLNDKLSALTKMLEHLEELILKDGE